MHQADLPTVLREWGRIGCVGFGGPPTHIALLRKLCVDDRRWLSAQEFEDAIAACNLLPGPASTQLAIFCAWRVRGRPGALAGGAAFILPGLIVILALSALFLRGNPPLWVTAAGAGAGAAVAAVAAQAGLSLMPPGWKRAPEHSSRRRWLFYLLLGAAAAATVGPWLVLLLIACALTEVLAQRPHSAASPDSAPPQSAPLQSGPSQSGPSQGPPTQSAPPRNSPPHSAPTQSGPTQNGSPGAGPAPSAWRRLFRRPPRPGVAVLAMTGLGGGVLLSVAWVALKVGALSYGGGFVIIPLMQADAVDHYRWMTDAQFLNAVALGQITPGPVVHTVAVVGYAAAGLVGGLLAAAVAFGPSFAFILMGAHRFDQLRANPRVRAFLDGAAPAAIGAILGSIVPLVRALDQPWQYAVLAGAAILTLLLRRGPVLTLLTAATAGTLIVLAGAPLPQ
ncbi:chromate transporter [Actinoplanes sp. NPDC049596]|uniref:chromate transporter n=1 Tax=unclassified Actinoplanes TaxID=2626549 RepID=UPI00342E61CD